MGTQAVVEKNLEKRKNCNKNPWPIRIIKRINFIKKVWE